jgi:hypothetical protein
MQLSDVVGTGNGVGPAADRWFVDDDESLTRPGASEVHMRRFDTETTLHRRALGAVRIEASPDVVYQALTDFERHPNFIPHLARTERIDLPFSQRSRPGRVRLRHVFLKCQLYHFLEVGVTLDVVQKDDKGEVQFQILDTGSEGETLQGKWLVVPCPAYNQDEKDASTISGVGGVDSETGVVGRNMDGGRRNERSAEPASESNTASGLSKQATILKFAIEGRSLRRPPSRNPRQGFWLSADSVAAAELRDGGGEGPLPEGAVFEEIVLMLRSTREYMEEEQQQRAVSTASSGAGHDGVFQSVSDSEGGMRSYDLDLDRSLRGKLLALGFGADGLMPRRAELRALEDGVQLEQAVVDAGGFEAVARRLGLRLMGDRKPRGYWNDVLNVQREVLSFIDANDLETGVMPSRTQLEELGRKDIAKSLAKHGGAVGTAKKIGLVFRRYRPRKPAVLRSWVDDIPFLDPFMDS